MTRERTRQWELAFLLAAVIAIVADWVFFPGDPQWLDTMTWFLIVATYYFWGRRAGMDAQKKLESQS